MVQSRIHIICGICGSNEYMNYEIFKREFDEDTDETEY